MFYFINIPLFVHCLETCSTNLRLHNPCWLANIRPISDLCLQR